MLSVTSGGGRRSGARLGVLALLLLALAGGRVAAAQSIAAADLSSMSLEDLANIEITSVSRQAEPLSSAPAAVYVITNEDIRRSGYTSIPEILRLAPNLQVAQVSIDSYAITARGFNSTAANKLLVLIDGRTVYTPLFSGVFWDVQDVLLADIERIEVISGPGGTLWGANAVNGVINIITKHSRDTQGGLASFGAGNAKIDGSARYGGKLGEFSTYRLYLKGDEYRSSVAPDGTRMHNSWHKPQGGFRIDWEREGDALALQGDLYDGTEEGPTSNLDVFGHNLLSRWTRKFDSGSKLQLQAYYDYSNRSTPGNAAISEVSTYDLDVQHSFQLSDRQDIVWGGGYRYSEDRVAIGPGLFFNPARRSLNEGSLFVQDSVSLARDLKLILGMRLAANTFTGLAPLPSARLAWNVTDSVLLWSAVSRVVRTPSRLDRDIFQTSGSTTVVAGGRNFGNETLISYELGYRQKFSSRASVSISAFYNVYDELRSFEASPGGVLPVVIGNKMEGNTYGVEVWGNYRLTDWWRVSAGFNALHENLRFKPGSRDALGVTAAGDDPHHQVSARSSINITEKVEFDFGVREVGRLPNPAVPSYISVDARIGWRILENIELSLTATNLFDDRHQEFGSLPLQFGAPPLLNIGRTVFAAVRGKY